MPASRYVCVAAHIAYITGDKHTMPAAGHIYAYALVTARGVCI